MGMTTGEQWIDVTSLLDYADNKQVEYNLLTHKHRYRFIQKQENVETASGWYTGRGENDTNG